MVDMTGNVKEAHNPRGGRLRFARLGGVWVAFERVGRAWARRGDVPAPANATTRELLALYQGKNPYVEATHLHADAEAPDDEDEEDEDGEDEEDEEDEEEDEEDEDEDGEDEEDEEDEEEDEEGEENSDNRNSGDAGNAGNVGGVDPHLNADAPEGEKEEGEKKGES